MKYLNDLVEVKYSNRPLAFARIVGINPGSPHPYLCLVPLDFCRGSSYKDYISWKRNIDLVNKDFSTSEYLQFKFFPFGEQEILRKII